MLLGTFSEEVMRRVSAVNVRSTENFNWTFIFILAVVFYIYWTEIRAKNFKAVIAGLSLWGLQWFFEICNAIIYHFAGWPLWTVTNESTSFILLIGDSWELSMMFAIAGIISWKMLPDDRNMRIFTAGGKKKGLSARLAITILMAFFFSVFEFFLVLTPSFLWVWKWWGAIPVFILIYIPLFWVANYVPDFSKKGRALYLGILWGLVAVLLATLVPLGII